MINGKKAKELDIKPERVRELVIEIENQGKINLKEIQIYIQSPTPDRCGHVP